MEIVDSESPGQTTHCSRFPDPKVSTYVPCFNRLSLNSSFSYVSLKVLR